MDHSRLTATVCGSSQVDPRTVTNEHVQGGCDSYRDLFVDHLRGERAYEVSHGAKRSVDSRLGHYQGLENGRARRSG